MSVAIPTAIPVDPFSKIFGSLAGNILGSKIVLSKFGIQLIVLSSSLLNKLSAYLDNLDSVYLIAANDFGSSGEPQLP